MDTPIEIIEKRWDDHARSYDDANQSYAGDAWMDVLDSHLPKDKNSTIVDVGTGTGFLSLYVARLGYRCYGVDMSEGMLAIARERADTAGMNLKLVRAVSEHLPFENESVDVVVNRWLLWTLLEPQLSLREWMRVLKRGGTLLCFCTVAIRDDAQDHRHYSDEIEAMLPLKNASADTLVETLEISGLADVEAIACPRLLAHDPDANQWYLIKGKKK
jgi:ubiquinone/menaquinone biosynthesis C-methylase UbiE